MTRESDTIALPRIPRPDLSAVVRPVGGEAYIQRIRFRLAGLIVGLTVVACGAAGPSADAPSARVTATTPATATLVTADRAPNMVWMGDHFFSPSQVTIKIGTTVTWRMLGSQEHDVWSLDGSFHSPTMGPGAVFTHTFTKPGIFKYICLPHHGDGMFGEITVEP